MGFIFQSLIHPKHWVATPILSPIHPKYLVRFPTILSSPPLSLTTGFPTPILSPIHPKYLVRFPTILLSRPLSLTTGFPTPTLHSIIHLKYWIAISSFQSLIHPNTDSTFQVLWFTLHPSFKTVVFNFILTLGSKLVCSNSLTRPSREMNENLHIKLF